jgi:hypothetical protein
MKNIEELRGAVVEALESLGGCGTVAEISSIMHDNYENKWENIGQEISQLCVDNKSSKYPPWMRVLRQVSSGRFCLTKWHENNL